MLWSLDTVPAIPSNGSPGSFFPWVTSDQGKLLTPQMGQLELRRQKRPSLKSLLAEGTESRTPKSSLLLSVYPGPPAPPKPKNVLSSGTAVSIGLDFHTHKASYQRLVHQGSPLLGGYHQSRPAKACANGEGELHLTHSSYFHGEVDFKRLF